MDGAEYCVHMIKWNLKQIKSRRKEFGDKEAGSEKGPLDTIQTNLADIINMIFNNIFSRSSHRLIDDDDDDEAKGRVW